MEHVGSLLSIRLFVAALLSLVLGAFVYGKNKSSKLNQAFLFICLSVFLWLFFDGIIAVIDNLSLVRFFSLVAYSGVYIIPYCILTFAVTLTKSEVVAYKIKYFARVATVVFLLLLNFTPWMVDGVVMYQWGYYQKAHWPNIFFILYYSAVYSYSLILLFLYQRKDGLSNLERNRVRFVFFSLLIPFFCIFDFGPSFGFGYQPFGHIFIFIWLSLTAYAILRYRLLEINALITRTTIFVAVYSIVLGIPFALAFGWKEFFVQRIGLNNWWMGPLITSTVLATVGPFIYLYIQKRAEEQLFKEQRRYQNTLRQASSGMGRIKDLKRLVNLTVHIISRTVRLEHSTLYLFDKKDKKFYLRAARSQNPRFKCPPAIELESELVAHLKRSRNPIVYEEIKQRSQDYADRRLHKLEEEVAAIKAALVVPAMIDERLLAVIVLGGKMSGQSYTEDDLTVFSILANQAALAIENAQFFADMKQTTEQLFKAEKMATIGTMADGLSHQINNRLHALGFIAGDALDTLKLKKDLANTPELKDVFVDLERAFGRIEENVTHGGEIVRGLLKYTRKTEHGMSEVVLDDVISSALSMTQFKIKPGELVLKREYDAKAIPKIKGNFAELQEVFFNLIDNAYDAMMQRKKERQEEGYQATINVTVSHSGNGHINIFFQDNGLGIREDDKEKLFTPFFTTKLSSQKGTGLGLFVIQKLIEENHKGRVNYQSEYGKGTLVHLHLPAVA